MKNLLLPFLLLLFITATAAEPDSAKTRRWSILPVPALGHAPETGWYGGAVCLLTYSPTDTLTRSSNFKTEFNYTEFKQLIFSTGWNYASPGNRYFFSGEAAYLHFPEDFYGIGNSTTSAQKENYDSRRIELELTLLWQWQPYLYFGPRYQLQHLYQVEPQPEGQLALADIPGAGGGTSSGAGWAFAFDKRDNLLNPKRGPYLSISQTFFGKTLKSDFTFSRYELDLRHYFKIRKNDVLAVQAVGQFSTGQPPFRMLPLLGSDADMRGYYRGRFRDRQYLAAQAEYRLPLFWRFGLTAFAGAGDVANKVSGFRFDSLKPTYGGGLRFVVDRQENINLRLDFAFGKNTTGFYVAFGEAF